MLLMRRYYRDGAPDPPLLLLEGLLAALVGMAFALWLFPAEASLVAVFLAALTTGDSMHRLLERNRAEILERGRSPWNANMRLTRCVLALFLGALAGYAAFGLVLEPGQVQGAFSHQIEALGGQDLLDLKFGHFSAIFVNNLYVLLFFFIIAIPFRQGGVMLAVAWNASVWGAAFGLLAWQWTEQGGPAPGRACLMVIASCLPHLLAEAGAYVMAGMAGLFLSKGLPKYDLESPVLASILRTVLRFIAISALLVALGAAWEGWVAPHLVALMSGGGMSGGGI